MNRPAEAHCCSPSRASVGAAAPARASAGAAVGPHVGAAPTSIRDAGDHPPAAPSPFDAPEMVGLEGGTFVMGSADQRAYPEDGETPREVEIGPFMIDRYAVSNAAFSAFVTATGHVTEAERFGWSFVFGGLLPEDFPPTRAVAAAPWWRQVYGAEWRHPAGPGSDIIATQDHPAVHISFNDAVAYCAWARKRLPTEAEWEFAARGGLVQAAFPWGNELEPSGEHPMNVWQGSFPNENTEADGHYGTCAVDAFPPNAYGLYNTTGNVWEWAADWFDPTFRARDRRVNPVGPATGTRRVQKGGSHLCHASYCRRYRVAARQGNEPDSTAGNLSFRCAADG